MISCSQVQAALSARLDGEPSGVPDDIVDAHLSGCPACQAYLDKAAALKRQLNIQHSEQVDLPTGPAPDLSALILEGIEPERRRVAASRALGLAIARVALVLVGIAYVVWATRTLTSPVFAGVSPAESGTPAYADPAVAGLVAEAAAFKLALAFGLFFAAWRPQASAGMLPIFGALWTFSFGFGVRDLMLGAMDSSTAVGLGLLFVSTVVLFAVWLSGYGLSAMSRAWRSITAQPTAV